jgi:hypothetical protein
MKGILMMLPTPTEYRNQNNLKTIQFADHLFECNWLVVFIKLER